MSAPDFESNDGACCLTKGMSLDEVLIVLAPVLTSLEFEPMCDEDRYLFGDFALPYPSGHPPQVARWDHAYVVRGGHGLSIWGYGGTEVEDWHMWIIDEREDGDDSGAARIRESIT